MTVRDLSVEDRKLFIRHEDPDAGLYMLTNDYHVHRRSNPFNNGHPALNLTSLETCVLHLDVEIMVVGEFVGRPGSD